MKKIVIIISALAVSVCAALVAQAQSPNDEMHALAVNKPGADRFPVVEFWKDRIAAMNAAYVRNSAELSFMRKLAPDENGPWTILWKEFKDGDNVVIASIVLDNTSEDGCAASANSSASAVSWAEDCPAKIVTILPTGEKKAQDTRACYQWFPLGSRGDLAEPDERTYATYDPSERTVSFRVTAKGKFVRSCTKNVKVR